MTVTAYNTHMSVITNLKKQRIFRFVRIRNCHSHTCKILMERKQKEKEGHREWDFCVCVIETREITETNNRRTTKVYTSSFSSAVHLSPLLFSFQF